MKVRPCSLPQSLIEQGTLTLDKDVSYVGGIYKGKPHGQGVKTWPSGKTVSGIFANGSLDGQGERNQPSSVKENCGWRNGSIDGPGVVTFFNGDVYEGELVMFKRHGWGTYLTKETGNRFEGEYYNGLKHGHGVANNRDGVI